MPYATKESHKTEARREVRTKNRRYKASQKGKAKDRARRERQTNKWYR